MSWEKSVSGQLARVVVQTTDTILPPGGVSAGNSSTTALGGNLLGGDRVWDKAAFFLDVDDVLTGTWTVEIQGTVAGISALPIARAVGVTPSKVSGSFAGTSTPPFGSSCIVFSNSAGIQSALCPSSVLFDNTAAGGLTATVIAVAKTNRGSLPKGTLNRSRVQEGVMFSIPAAGFTNGAPGITATRTIALADTNQGPAGTTCFGVLGGLGAVQVWDTQMYWMDVVGCSGIYNISVQGGVPGSSGHFVTIAALGNITGVTKAAFTTFGNAATIRPSRVVFDQVRTPGTSASINGTIVYVAKTSRGQRHLR